MESRTIGWSVQMADNEKPKPKRFKGWVVPGPEFYLAEQAQVDEAALKDEVSCEELTLDALSGHTKIFQLKNGNRFSTDDVLVAWYGTSFCNRVERALDLGSGIGSVALMVAWRLPGVRMTTVEAQEASFRLAQRSVKINGLQSRFSLHLGDLRQANLQGQTFDLITGSPPYFPESGGIHADHPQKVACRFELRGTVADYARAAAPLLSPGGVFAFVFPVDPPHQKERAFAAIGDAGLSCIRFRPIVLRAGANPLLGLFLCARATDLPEGIQQRTFLEPPLVIREANGAVSDEYRAVKLSVGFPP